ncbi:cell division protein FtsQ/DivIB [Anaerocolumna sp. AGMB13025]|uniref:cell division protein FtsQ/DivIB n=1 Tax=Anaerocolumna sp. AGMB13025 TaxID=3039116 RepID=UPI00241E2E43|nr:cell division protein FtsQ/DivIB [Anaerocolumna sp. AGMB13025]WFR54998.1 cell division protein FtsQ/DivIB [Anaerocolumna sp. AGMB13025]
MKEQREKHHNSAFLLGLMKLLILCLVIIIPAFILFITCRLDTVIVEGSNHYTKEELQDKVITKKTDRNTILLYLRYKYGKVDSIPFVEDIDIKLVNKNTVKIQVYEKVITGCIELMGEYMYFDKDGIVVESSDEKLPDVPFVTGLSFDRIILYEKLKVQQKSLFTVILNLTQLIKKFDIKVEKIQFDSSQEVTLYSGNIKILLGKRDTYDEQISELMNLLPKTKGQKITLDMRDFKEGQNEIIAKPQE